MNSIEYYERLRAVLEPMYDAVGLSHEQALNCDQMVFFTVQKHGPTEKACERVLENLKHLSIDPMQLEYLFEIVGYEPEMQPLERDALTEAAKRLSEAWGITPRPTAHPQAGVSVKHVRRSAVWHNDTLQMSSLDAFPMPVEGFCSRIFRLEAARGRKEGFTISRRSLNS